MAAFSSAVFSYRYFHMNCPLLFSKKRPPLQQVVPRAWLERSGTTEVPLRAMGEGSRDNPAATGALNGNNE